MPSQSAQDESHALRHQISQPSGERALPAAHGNRDNPTTQGSGEKFFCHIHRLKRIQKNFINESQHWQTELITAIHQGRGNYQGQIPATSELATQRQDRSATNILQSLHFSEIRDRHD